MKSRREISFGVAATPALLAIIIGAFALHASIVSARAVDQPAATPLPNRLPPKASPPPNPLDFSASPTVEEILRARVFEEPLVPIGGEPDAAENADLAAALRGYAHRSSQDDFASLAGFLEQHPTSVWRAAMLTGLGLEYYHTAHYSLALEAWKEAWAAGQNATTAQGKAIADRAGGELACMYARLGRTSELAALLKSIEGRVFVGSATEKIVGAGEGLWKMQHRPEISFCCGPMALGRILSSNQRLLTSATNAPPANAMKEIFNASSTERGFSLPQVEALSRKVGLNYQMAFRAKGGAFVVPSVVHWKVGHYAAMVRQEGERYLLEDPTFGNTAWATKQALEDEASGYFLIPPGSLGSGWRSVDANEGGSVWGKGLVVGSNDPRQNGPCDNPQSGGSNTCDDPCAIGMAVSSVHLMLVNLNLRDTPVGYSPPVGPPVRFTVRYNHREAFQPAIFTYANFGSKWTCDWISYITDNPSNALADVNFYIRGGGTRTFTSFDTNAQTYAFQQYDHTQLKRTGSASYEMVSPDGSKLVFGQSDGSVGTARKVFLTQVLDPFGNAATLTYDGNLRPVSITDAIGQVTTLSYGNTNDLYKITAVTDPFGRSASFSYDALGRLTNITDVIGLSSQFSYLTNGDFISTLTTPYGTSTFTASENNSGFTNRVLETVYPDGSRDRVEFNQSGNLGIPLSDPVSSVPQGMYTYDLDLYERNTYYWSRNACTTAYGDYTKARIYHWLVASDLSGLVASGIEESTKEPLENRVWFDYAGQTSTSQSSAFTGTSNQPQHVGRVLDDGTTQLYAYAYNGFGKLTNMIDPLGRTFSFLYASNGIDLLEVRMTRAGKNELLYRATYNAQHLPLTTTDAAGQTNFYTFNSRGQLLTATDPKNATTSYTYDTNGYLVAVTGPLGTNDVATATYDAYGRTRTRTDVSGYTLIFDYDALDRITRITHPDSTFEQITYNRLQPSVIQDRAGRQTLLQYDALGQLIQRTDPLGRVTRFQWCSCGDIKSLTDPMGRTTTWHKDLQDRLIAKQFGDRSQITYTYENTTSRLREVQDEKLQFTSYDYNLDNTVRAIGYANTATLTPGVNFTYDPDYPRLTSMTDGTGTTLYQYVPITTTLALGAGKLTSETGPLPNSTITYSYDELGRRVSTAINGVASTLTFDAAGRVTGETNALGSFSYVYDGASGRIILEAFPNGQTTSRAYFDKVGDFTLQRITYAAGAIPVSQFQYEHDLPANRITTWSQQAAALAPDVYTFGYDNANQLLSALVTNSGARVTAFAYSYDPAGNRLTEQVGGAVNAAAYNALNQEASVTGAGASQTNEWDASDRLVAVNSPSQRTEFAYDGINRLASIRLLTNGVQASMRRFVWSGDRVGEERDAAGTRTKQYFEQGMRLESGANAGNYYYTRDHLRSIRELTDSGGNVRARYAYDPYGRPTRLAGDLQADFGFAGMLWSAEAGLALTRFRAYDANVGRWLSRDPLGNAEVEEGPNLYLYVANNPINRTDPLGLFGDTGHIPTPPSAPDCCAAEEAAVDKLLHEIYTTGRCGRAQRQADAACQDAYANRNPNAYWICSRARLHASDVCEGIIGDNAALQNALEALERCRAKPCKKSCSPPPAPQPHFDPYGYGHVWFE